MGAHVYVTLLGFGRRVVAARAPFASVREADDRLVVTCGASRRVVAVDEPISAALSPDSVVADVIAGPTVDGWWVDGGPYVAPFPEGWTVEATGDDAPTFFFVGTHEDMVHIETPQNIPSVDRLIAPGESVVARGASWVEVAYAHEGRPWTQRRTIVAEDDVPRGVVVAQAPSASFGAARALHLSIVEQVVFKAR